MTATGGGPGSLGQYLRFLWRRKLSLVLPVLIAAGAAYAVANRQEPVYESFTDLLYSTAPGAADAGRAVSVATEARVATSPAVLDAAAKSLHGPGAEASTLGAAVEARQAGDIAVLRVSARHGSAAAAAETAKAVADAYLAERTSRTQARMVADAAEITERLNEIAAEIDRLAGEAATGDAAGQPRQAAAARQQMNLLVGEQSVQQARLYQLRLAAAASGDDVSVLVPPAVPAEPVSPRPRQSALIGGLVGLLAGLALAMAREHLGTAVRSADDVESLLMVPLLGVVPRMGRRQFRRSPVAILDRPDSDAAESFRILRANLTAAGVGDDIRVVVVTSAVSEEGKSTTAANLAASFAEAGVNTLLVDGDLRRPEVHRVFKRSNRSGLTSLLGGRLEQSEISALMGEVRVGPNLAVLPAGPATDRPAQMVISSQLTRIVTALRSTYLMVIDAPPVLPVADIGALTAAADAVLVVVRPARARGPMLAHLRSRLSQLNAPVLGAVVNAADRSSFETGSTYGYYHGYGPAHSDNGSAGAFAKFLRTSR